MTPPTPNDLAATAPGAQQQPASAEPAAPQQQPAAEAPQQAPGETPKPEAKPEAPKPPWGSDDEFDPQRAWSLIQNLRNENAEFKAKAQPILDEHERLRRASQTELDLAREDLGNATKVAETWRNRAVTAEAKALAADKFVDSEVALALVGDLSGFVDGDAIDTNKLSQRLDQLAADKPFLVKQPPQQGMTPNRGQGRSATGPVTAAQIAQHAESQQDWKAAGAAKAQQLLNLRAQQA